MSDSIRRLRVLHIGKYLPPFAGGMEHFLWDLLQAQQQGGIDAAALVHHERPGWHAAHPRAGVTPVVYRAPCLGRVLYVPVAPSFARWLARAIRAFRPDLLHLHLPNSSALLALALPSARRIPWVVHWHSDLVASTLDRRLALAYRLYRPLEQRLLRRSRAVIATSPTYLEASDALRPWRDRCEIVPLGLDPTRLAAPTRALEAEAEALWAQRLPGQRLSGQQAPEPAAELTEEPAAALGSALPTTEPTVSGPAVSAPGALRVLAIGRLTYYKGHEVLIRAMTATPGATLVIVGSGDLEPRLRRQIAAAGLAHRVQLRPGCSDAEVSALLKSCDLLCLPSLERTEAFGLVLLEAMRFGKPVVVSDIPGSGAGWVVEQARNGLLTLPGDAASLAAALNRLAASPAQRERLGEQGARALHERFQIRAIAEAIAPLYQQALAPLD